MCERYPVGQGKPRIVIKPRRGGAASQQFNQVEVKMEPANVLAGEKREGVINLTRTQAERRAGRRHLRFIKHTETGPALCLPQEAVSQTQPGVAKARPIPTSVHDVKKIGRRPVEVEIMGKTQAQPARKIVSIRATARPLPFQAILEFDDAALGRVGGAGYGWPAGHGNHRYADARGLRRSGWLLSQCPCDIKKQNYQDKQE